MDGIVFGDSYEIGPPKRKYPKANAQLILKHRQPSQLRPRWKVWRGQAVEHYQMGWQKVMHYRRGWMKPPEFMIVLGEPDA